jgi:hypothetical protein
MDWSSIHWMQLGCPDNLLPFLENFLPLLQNSLFPASFDAPRFPALLDSLNVLLVLCADATLRQVLAFDHSVLTLCMPGHPSERLRHQSLSAQGLLLHWMRHQMLCGITNGGLTLGFQGVSFAAFKPPLR